MTVRIYIDIGHGENGDPGAVNGNLIEHQMNIVTGNACAERLIQYGYGVLVEQGNLDITSSAITANNFGADYCISFHENAGGGDRGEVLHSWKDGAEEFANVIATGLYNAGQTQVNIVKSKANSNGTAEYFGMLRTTIMPSVIVEPCFIDNDVDRQLADTIEEQKNIGVCIADAIANVYGGEIQVEQWKKDIIAKAIKYGLITTDKNPDESASIWFVLAVIMNLLEKYILKIK